MTRSKNAYSTTSSLSITKVTSSMTKYMPYAAHMKWAILNSTAIVAVGAGAAVAGPMPATDASTLSDVSQYSLTTTGRALNVGLAHGGFSGVPDAQLIFVTFDSESMRRLGAVVRVFTVDDVTLDHAVAELPVDVSGEARWTTPKGGEEYQYVLRAYEANGQYTETQPRLLKISNDEPMEDATIGPAVKSLRLPTQTPAVPRAERRKSTPRVARVETGISIAPKAAEPTPAQEVIEPARILRGANSEPVQSSLQFGSNVNGHLADMSDLVLAGSDLQMSFDALSAQPLLNVGIVGDGVSAAPGEPVTFEPYWNYDHWISRAEICVYDAEDTLIKAPIITLPLDGGKPVKWSVPVARSTGAYTYVLRVYGENGAFDETVAKRLTVHSGAKSAATSIVKLPATYGHDATRVRGIDLARAGTVTISGEVMEGGEVKVFGKTVPAADNGRFSAQQLLPAGDYTIPVNYEDSDGASVDINRTLSIPESDWFLVAIGDLTVGKRGSDGRALLEASGEEFDDTFVTGRAAFYLKGRIKGEYLITAAMDTTEDDIDNLFSNLDKKDPSSLLRRIDPNRYYPVYGDDSTSYEDAPTQGRFYVRVEHGNDEVVWGNFMTDIRQTEFSQIDRGLYGAKVEYNSDAVTSEGEARMSVTAFAADPGTLPAREEFRGTGGSVYFLEHQDVSIGSERLRIELRDENSGLVVATQDLRPFLDYEIDYIQGRVLLAKPLASTSFDNRIVRNGTLSGGRAYLVSRYEFTTGVQDVEGYTTGGRIEAWLTDNIRVGINAQDEGTADLDQTLIAGDITARLTDKTYIKAEIAETDGPGFSERASSDGGFTYDALNSAAVNDTATAWRVEGAADLNELMDMSINAEISAYLENLDAGFSGAGRLTQADTQRSGVQLKTGVEDARSLDIKVDTVEIDNGLEELSASADLRSYLTENISAGVGIRYSDVSGSLVGREGSRTDVGAELRYDVSDDSEIYVFGQTTVDADDTREDADRVGVGIDAAVSERLSVRGEVSGGDGGVGALAGLAYTRAEGEEYYLNYTMDAERRESGVDGGNIFGSSQNALVGGVRKRFNDYVSVYGEERASFGDAEGLTHAYGLTLTPDDKWTIGISAESGDLEENQRIIERDALTVSAGFNSKTVNLGGAMEWRDDDIDGVGLQTWLLRTNIGVQVNEDWRALAKFNKAESDAGAGAFFDGEFTETQIGAAYRPVENDRLNALVRYTYFEDLPAAQQVSNSGQTALAAQKSSVVNVDGIYDVTSWLSVGAKYGYRWGEVSLSRLDEDFYESNAHLGVLRADVHFTKKWDAVLEGRVLSVEEAGDESKGFLAAIYRHLGDNAKVGIGYNFTDFSDDLTDLSHDEGGVFVNIIAKY